MRLLSFVFLVPLVACRTNAPSPPPLVVLGGASAIVEEDSAVDLTLLADAGSDLRINITRTPEHGALNLNEGVAPFIVRYTPVPDYAGSDSFDFTVSDEQGVLLEDSATVSVVPVNDAPRAVDDGPIAASGALTIAVLLNDSDKDDTRLLVTITTPPASGSATVNGDQTITFVPEQAGDVTMGYRITDTAGAWAEAFVAITVSTPFAISAFTASPPAALAGEQVTLSWESTGAAACEMSAADAAIANGTSGHLQVTIAGVTVYLLRCHAGASSLTRALAVYELPDFDQDGITDHEEVTTSPAFADSDGDGLCDGDAMVGACVGTELAFGTNPSLADEDGDGLSDGAEFLHGTSATDTDSDDDGLRDGQEDRNGDGIVQIGETDPADPDTNNDGLCDGLRVDNDGNGIAPADPCLAPVVLVDASAPTGGNGVSWASAFNTVQAGMDAAVAGQAVYVASGIYTAASAEAPVLTMTNNARVYGGFLGTESSVADRPNPLPPTVLSGDRDDSESCSSGDSVHVVVAGADSVLDGFTVERGCGASGGSAYDNSGAGIYHIIGALEVTNSVLHHNSIGSWVANAGGALYAGPGTTLTVTHTRFFENQALQSGTNGGAVGVRGASATFSDVVFDKNIAEYHYGGGIWCVESGTLDVSDAIFAFNDSGEEGAGAYLYPCAATMSKLAFAQNNGGGGLYLLSGAASSSVDRVAIVGNNGSIGGAFIGSNVTGQPVVTNVSVHANTSAGGGAALWLSNARASDLSVTANVSGHRAVMLANAPSLVNTTIAGNTVGQAAIETLGSASGTVNNAALYDNSAAGGDFTQGTSTVSVGNSCSQENLTAFGAGNATLVLSPFSATFASQHVYLQPLAGDPSCINRGDDAVATAAGSAWSMLSAYANGSLDLDSGDGLSIGNDVDAGRHYHPLAVRIPTMAATISDVSWTTDNASTCRLLDSATNAMTSLLSATLPSGTLSHGQTSGAQLVLICFGVNGEPAIARATVP